MYALTRAGIPTIQGLTSLAASTPNERLGEIIREVVSDLESGRDMAGALARHPHTFPTLYISMVHVGEESGRLEEALWRLFQYLEREKVTVDRIKSALRYPTVVIVAVGIAIGILTVMVIPAFAKVFSNFDMQLPWATRLILGFSEFMAVWWPGVLALLVGAYIGLRAWTRTARGRLIWDRYKLRLPVVGDILERATLARFARSFAMTSRAGVPVTQGLLSVARAVDNAYLSRKIRGMNTGIQRGDNLTRVATNSGMFTPLVLQMLALGEETGQIDDMMEEAAEFYEREVDYDIDRLSDLIQPVITVILGVMVLILALGVFLPMWDLTQIA
ncbi:MAG: type II secretion system F family protein [Acidimicrobiia bacterium]|nr:type II secretion system F family protein [Acidimicrobiia bacterium]